MSPHVTDPEWADVDSWEAERVARAAAESASMNGTRPPANKPRSEASSLEQRLADARVDLLAILDGGLPVRAWLPCSERMLARGSRHHVAAPLKSGKSIGFLAHAVDMTIGGARVVILDRENGEQEYARRLGDVLADRPPDARDAVRDRLAYFAWPALKLTDGPELGGAFCSVDLVILDSTRTFLSSLALDEDRSDDFARFSTAIVEPLFRAGIATVQLDNTGHGDKSRARGSSSKGDLADVLYSLKTTAAFDQHRRGTLRLVRAHARFGDVGGAFTMDLGAGHFGTFTMEDGDDAEGRATFRPTVLMERVSRALEESPGLPKRAVRATVKGNTNAVDLALELLIADGHVRADVDGQAHRHHVVQPYREADDSHRDHRDQGVTNRDQSTGATDRDHVTPSKGSRVTGHGRIEAA